MLAFTAKMSLTQVSTWFANARRRIKKDSRLVHRLSLQDRVRTVYGDEEARLSHSVVVETGQNDIRLAGCDEAEVSDNVDNKDNYGRLYLYC